MWKHFRIHYSGYPLIWHRPAMNTCACHPEWMLLNWMWLNVCCVGCFCWRDRLDLSILLSRGSGTNVETLSSGERSGWVVSGEFRVRDCTVAVSVVVLICYSCVQASGVWCDTWPVLRFRVALLCSGVWTGYGVNLNRIIMRKLIAYKYHEGKFWRPWGCLVWNWGVRSCWRKCSMVLQPFDWNYVFLCGLRWYDYWWFVHSVWVLVHVTKYL